MKIICTSDTHGQHRKTNLPAGDLLIHAGDVSHGRKHEIPDFIDWFCNQPHPFKIFIGGNMDYLLETEAERFKKMLPANVFYLENEKLTIEGIKIWASPAIPRYVGAFNFDRGEPLRKIWERIPSGTDILITHTPPFSILDKTSRGLTVGCKDLLAAVKKVRPKLHVFGHVHEAYGQVSQGGTLFVNASHMRNWHPENAAIEIDWPV